MKIDNSEEFINFIYLIKQYNYPLYFFNHPIAKKQLPKELRVAFEQLVQATGMLDIDLPKILKQYYQPDKQRNIPHVFKSIDGIESLNIAKKRFKSIEFDKDGLILVPRESKIIRDGFEFGNHFLIYPMFLRDHESLLDWIAEYRKEQWELKFLIDHDILGISNTIRTNYFSKAHQFGPKTIQEVKKHFKRKQQVIFYDESFYPDRVEIAFSVKKDGELHLDFEELLHYPIRSLDYTKNAFEINNVAYIYFMRFAHVILDNDWRRCRHLDLSIRSYNALDTFSERIKSNIAGFGRHQQYLKLVKINSLSNDYSIPYEDLITRFFFYNPYIIEFFEGITGEQELIEHRRNMLVSSLRNSNLLIEYI